MNRLPKLFVLLLGSLVFLSEVSAMGPVEVGSILVASFIGILLFWFFIFFIVFAGAIFWVWMFIDCLTRENYREQNDKVVWVIVLLLASFLGAIIYYFFIKRKLGVKQVRKRDKKPKKRR